MFPQDGRNTKRGNVYDARLPVRLRDHGSVAAAQSVNHVVFRAIYTEVDARTEIQALAIGRPGFLNDKEAAAAMKTNDGLVHRPWALWKQKAMPG
jgi:HCOMODA/2-hydroxy-3-carboxy-muconic semialdehyde decarboxylase